MLNSIAWTGVRVLVAAALITFAVSSAVLILFSAPVFVFLDFHPIALDYIHQNISRSHLEETFILGQTFRATQIDHLDDVTALLTVLFRVFAGTATVIISTLLIDCRLLRSAASLAFIGLALTCAVIIGSFFVLGFQTVSIGFHQVIFPQGNWSFPWHSLIIQLYGTQVMIRGAVFAICLGIAILVIIYLLTRRIRRR